MMIKFYPHQESELEATENLNRVAYYHDMGLGKTFTGAEKMIRLDEKVNLVVCQKSKVNDWIEHFQKYYGWKVKVFDLTKPVEFELFTGQAMADKNMIVGIINYELTYRREYLNWLSNFTLMLDESSIIQNDTTKTCKCISRFKFKNLILLSGTPTSGKYENLLSQLNLLGWNISKELFWKQYVDFHYDDNEGFPIKIVDGYKNVERLKSKLATYGARFLKTEDVFELPEQIFNQINIGTTKEYRRFKKSSIVSIGEKQFVGDTTLTKMLYERQLCGSYNKEKLDTLKDLMLSTEDRLIVFYNFNDELHAIEDLCIELNKPVSIYNGTTKDESCWKEYDNAVMLVQYQSGAMGKNWQEGNKIIYFTPPLSSELFEQSKKRVHRIGQNKNCFYYMLICKNSIEEKIYKTLEMRKDYTLKLFEKG